MNDLFDSKPVRPMDRSLAGAEIAGLNDLIKMLNNPEITGASVPNGAVTQAPGDALGQMLLPGMAMFAATPVAMPEPQPAPVNTRNASKLFFTGKIRIGKDYVAKATGAALFGFADPIYELASALTGLDITANKGKDIPGVRQLLQAIGQWGRDEVNAQYPVTPARILFCSMIRTTTGHTDFGVNRDLWIEHLLARWQEWAATHFNARAAITNVRFVNEFKTLTAASWTHWHIMSSPATWAKRLSEAKLTPSSPAVLDSSEQLAASLDASVIKQISAQKTGPLLRCIWNDTETKPPSSRLHTLSSFLHTLDISEAPSEADDSGILTGE